MPPLRLWSYRAGILLGLLLIAQGLFRFILVDPLDVADLLGIPRDSPLQFFAIPFLVLGARFLWVCALPLRLAARGRLGEPGPGEASLVILGTLRLAVPAADALRLAEAFLGWCADFVTWTMAMFAAFMAAGTMVAAKWIPNQDPPLFEVILNVYLGVYLLVLEPRARLLDLLHGWLERRAREAEVARAGPP